MHFSFTTNHSQCKNIKWLENSTYMSKLTLVIWPRRNLNQSE